MASGKIVLGRVQPKYQGDYDAARAYTALDQVIYGGLLFQCVADAAAGIEPKAEKSAYWVCLGTDAAKLGQLQKELAAKAEASELEKVRAGLDDKLSLSGGVMTGALEIKNTTANNPSFTARFIDFPVTDIPDSYTYAIYARIYGDAQLAPGYFQVSHDSADTVQNAILARKRINGEDKISQVGPCVDANGTSFAYSSPPRENAYSDDIDTLRASINRHPIKISGSKTYHVGGENASDTADLFMGRGESAEMPFATLQACLNFLSYNTLIGGFAIITIVLHEDQNITGTWWLPELNSYQIHITSDSVKRKITVSSNCHFSSSIGFYNVIIDALYIQVSGWRKGVCVRFLGDVEIIGRAAPGGYPALIGSARAYVTIETESSRGINKITSANGNGYLGAYSGSYLGLFVPEIALSGMNDETGKAVGIYAVAGGSVVFASAQISISDDGVTKGKRYAAEKGGRIITGGKGPDFIPGTIAGTCDESSIYA